MICRLCGEESIQTQDLFRSKSGSGSESEENEDPTAAELRLLHRKIRLLFSIRVKCTDVTTSVCPSCVKLVDQFYIFHNKVKFINESLSKKKSSVSDSLFSEDNKLKTESGDEVIESKLLFIKEENFYDSNDLSNAPLDQNNIFAQDSDLKPDVNIYIQNENNSPSPSYRSDNDNSNFEHMQVEESSENLYKKDVSSSKKTDKRILKKRKLKKKRRSSCDELENIKILENSINCVDYSYPTEVIKDGKLIIKGSSLAILIAKFYNLRCDLCSGSPSFQSLSKLMKHFDSTHKIQGYVTCCNTQFHQHRSIYMHMARHLQPSAFECPICKKAVSRPHSLKLHLQTHLPEEEKPHQCDECPKKFSHADGLINHKRTHVPVEERETYFCQICGKKFTLASSFATHMRSIHSGMKYLCSDCGRSFRRKTELTFHMLTHDSTGKNRVKCQQCGYVCKNVPTLKVHMKRHSEDRLKCNLCEYTTHRRQQLNIHMRVKHSDEKPFGCVVCGKQFKLKNVLKTHMAQHTGEHKYACTYCPKKFISPGNYHSHRKRMHAEEHQNEKLMKQKEQFKKIESLQEETQEDKSLVHEVARICLKKIAENNMNKKSIAL